MKAATEIKTRLPMCVCVCVCVLEKERRREKTSFQDIFPNQFPKDGQIRRDKQSDFAHTQTQTLEKEEYQDE